MGAKVETRIEHHYELILSCDFPGCRNQAKFSGEGRYLDSAKAGWYVMRGGAICPEHNQNTKDP